MRRPNLLSSRFIPFFPLVLAVSVVSCSRGQTGGDIDIGENTSDGFGCEEVDIQDVDLGASIDGTSLKLDDLVSMLEGNFETEMRWEPRGAGSNATVTPAAGDTGLSIQIEVLPDTGRWVERQQASNDNGGEDIALTADFAALPCPDELRVDANVTLESDNGALDDTFVVTFATTDGVVASGSVALEPGTLDGSFDVEVTGLENGKASQTELALSVAFGTLSGTISGIIESQNSEVASAGGIEYARFPSSNPCQTGMYVDPETDVVTELQASLDAHTAFDFTWQGADPIAMDVVPTLGAVCFESGSGNEPSLNADLSLVVTTEDDSIDGTWALAANALIEDGSVGAIHVYRDAYLADTFAADQFEAATGIKNVESSAEALSFSFGYDIDPAQNTPVTGELTILEISIPDCAQPDYMPPEMDTNGAMSGGAPGCAGLDATETLNATLIERE